MELSAEDMTRVAKIATLPPRFTADTAAGRGSSNAKLRLLISVC